MQSNSSKFDSDSGEEDYEMVQRSPEPQQPQQPQPEAAAEAYYDPRYAVLIAGTGSPSNSPSAQLYLQLRPRTVGRRKWMLAGPLGFMLLCGGLLASVCLVVPLAMISLSYGACCACCCFGPWRVLRLRVDDQFVSRNCVEEQAR
jgi:hypothetical protein